MLEAAGLLEDAFREYFELEACYLEALKQGGNLAGRQFGEPLRLFPCLQTVVLFVCASQESKSCLCVTNRSAKRVLGRCANSFTKQLNRVYKGFVHVWEPCSACLSHCTVMHVSVLESESVCD